MHRATVLLWFQNDALSPKMVHKALAHWPQPRPSEPAGDLPRFPCFHFLPTGRLQVGSHLPVTWSVVSETFSELLLSLSPGVRLWNTRLQGLKVPSQPPEALQTWSHTRSFPAVGVCLVFWEAMVDMLLCPLPGESPWWALPDDNSTALCPT
jgi:hypothetical protein